MGGQKQQYSVSFISATLPMIVGPGSRSKGELVQFEMGKDGKYTKSKERSDQLVYDYDKKEYTDDWKKYIQRKMEDVLLLAYYEGHDSIVLTAWGSGYNNHYAARIAELWKEVFERRFGGIKLRCHFDEIVFAIIEDHASLRK